MSRFFNRRLDSLETYVPGEQPRMQNLIKLNTNESPFPPAPGVVEAAAKAAGTLRLYNDLSASGLIRKLSETYALPPECIAVSNGSDEMLAFAFQAFGEKGAAFPDITYGFYPVWAALYGIDAKVFPLDGDFRIRPEDYQGCGRMIVIANPNAPTGIALTLDEILSIVENNPDSVVIVDEAYVDFGAESAVSLIPDHENMLVVQTFSKSRQMAGARLGFALGSPDLIADLNRIRYSFHPYNVNSMTQAAGEAALSQKEYFDTCRRTIMETRLWTARQLKEIGFTVLDSKANFLFASPAGMSGAEYQRRLRDQNVVIRRFDLPRIRDYLRITIGSKEQMEVLIALTKEMFQ